MQKYFVLSVMTGPITLLLTQTTFADSNCPNALSNESQIEHDDIHLTFQESISILTNAEKLQMLSDLNIEEPKRDAIIRIGIIRDIQTQDRILRDVLGLDQLTIDIIRSRGILQIHPIEYQKFTTVPPANPAHIQPGAIISAVNSNGYLKNATIEKIEGENVYIRFDNTKVPAIISKQEAHQPILKGRQIYYYDNKGIPKINYIIDTNPDESYQYLLKHLEKNHTQKGLSISNLYLRPRKETVTNKKDYSNKITPIAVISLMYHYTQLIKEYSKSNDIDQKVIQLNNDLLKKLSIEMRKAGIVTRLQPNIHFRDDSMAYDPPIMNLSIEGVHENGNKLMRRYMKIAEKLNVPSIEIFPLINFIASKEGSSTEEENMIYLNFSSAVYILKKVISQSMSHELTHSMIHFRDIINTGSGFYKTRFTASNTSPLNNNGIYDDELSLSELYTHASDLLFFSKIFLKMQAHPIKRFLYKIIYQDIQSTIYKIKVINISVQTIVEGALQRHQDQKSFSDYLKDEISYMDNEGREIKIIIPRQNIENILNSSLSRLLQPELQVLIEELRTSLTSFVPSDIHLIQNYIEFLESDPTVTEFLEQKKQLGYYRDSTRKKMRSLHFKKFIENKIEYIEERITQLAEQEVRQRLERIKSLTERVSYQLDIIEHHIQSNGLAKPIKLFNNRDKLKSLIRAVKELQLILYREI